MATAIVAALIALVGILVARWLFTIPLLAPKRDGAWGDASTVGYTLAAAGAALVATALLHLLLLTTPRPNVFFGWIMALGTIIAVVFPFSTTASLAAKSATAVVNLVLGIAIGALLLSVAGRAVRVQRRRPTSGYDSRPPDTRLPGDRYR